LELEKNKSIARRFSQVWGTGDLEILDELASPEITVSFPVFPHAIKGIAAFKEMLTRLRSAFGNADIQIEEEIAEGDKVVLRWSFSATHQAEFPPGIRPTGKRLKWTGISIYRIVDGKVVEETGEEDYLGILRQLGLIPESRAQ
jgi:predicted ester cyclase